MKRDKKMLYINFPYTHYIYFNAIIVIRENSNKIIYSFN